MMLQIQVVAAFSSQTVSARQDGQKGYLASARRPETANHGMSLDLGSERILQVEIETRGPLWTYEYSAAPST